MTDPFAAGLAALHSSAISAAATYSPAGGGPVATIRVIRSQPDRVVDPPFADTRYVVATNSFDILRSEVTQPVEGGVIATEDGEFRIVGSPELDTEGMTWRCGAEPV